MKYSFAKERRKTAAIITLIVLLLLCLAINAALTYFLLKKNGGVDGKIGVNVTSGECKIDIIDTENKTLVGDVLDFESASGNEKLYFEPGATYRTQGFIVKNEGSIPVDFRIYISVDEADISAGFQEAFDLWISKDASNYENAERLTEFTGKLEVNEQSEVFYLIIKMKENAGNEFQNKTYTGIGITVCAVQRNAPLT